MMKTTNQYLDEVKTRLRLPSDYALAKTLGVTTSSVVSFRNGRSAVGIETAMKIAEILGIDEHQVYGDGQLERAKTPAVHTFWKEVSEKFSVSFLNLLSGAGPRRDSVLTC
jgi:DNA-binding XRE family transcriptional regulator